jgi:hypothetical protein
VAKIFDRTENKDDFGFPGKSLHQRTRLNSAGHLVKGRGGSVNEWRDSTE